MPLLVTGSIGIDTVETPHGRAENVLGGSAVYFSLAAALYAQTRLVAVVGEDFNHDWFEPLRRREVDLNGLEVRKGSKTFRWTGRYEGAMNEAETLDVALNVLAENAPPIPDSFQDTRYLFLANTHPALQIEFADRLKNAQFVMADTMNLWIKSEHELLLKALTKVDGLVLNEGEAQLLTDTDNLVRAGRDILKMGPSVVIVKKGEHGAICLYGDEICTMPAFPTEKVIDPTGCGDTFAGALMGYLTMKGKHDMDTMRAAMARGTAAASIVLESFSINASAEATREAVEARVKTLRSAMEFA
ncbi:MAG: PfkB family carbohydrate kinase [Phycisphaerae bacterium]